MAFPFDPRVTYASRFLPIWFLLAAQGGFVNAFGFVACGRYVSHVTGIGTMFGLSFGRRELWVALEMLAVIGVFIAGSFVATCATTVFAHHGKKPRLLTINFVMAALLAVIATLGVGGWFGTMGDQTIEAREVFLLLALSFICGLQNGTFSLLTQGQIRTTHLTGLSTDLGADLAHLLFARGRKTPVPVHRVGATRILLVIGFAGGALLAALGGYEFGYAALFAPCAVALFVGIYLERQIESLRSANAVAITPTGATTERRAPTPALESRSAEDRTKSRSAREDLPL